MPILGITGGIATGKSTFQKLLRDRLEAAFFDTDACAKELLDQDLSVREAITAQIHPQAYDSAGKPDRKLIREVVYRDPSAKQKLEAILHPLIRQTWVRQTEQARAKGEWFIVDIPLLFETKAESFFDHIILIACSVRQQMSRMAARGLTAEISEKIIASQMPTGVKIKGSHHVIWNDGLPESLATQADLFSKYLHARYG